MPAHVPHCGHKCLSHESEKAVTFIWSRAFLVRATKGETTLHEHWNKFQFFFCCSHIYIYMYIYMCGRSQAKTPLILKSEAQQWAVSASLSHVSLWLWKRAAAYMWRDINLIPSYFPFLINCRLKKNESGYISALYVYIIYKHVFTLSLWTLNMFLMYNSV